jgi:hypothetical protein
MGHDFVGATDADFAFAPECAPHQLPPTTL